MKCPKCNGEMEEGFVGDSWGDVGQGTSKQEWGTKRNFIGQLKTEKKIISHRCLNCGYIESYAK